MPTRSACRTRRWLGSRPPRTSARGLGRSSRSASPSGRVADPTLNAGTRVGGPGATRAIRSERVVDDAVLGEELFDPWCEASFDDLAERHPRGLGGVAARHRFGPFEAGDGEVEDHEMVLVGDLFAPADEVAAEAVDAGLLTQLAEDRGGEGLAGLDPTAGDRPLPRRGPVTPAHHQQVLVVDH